MMAFGIRIRLRESAGCVETNLVLVTAWLAWWSVFGNRTGLITLVIIKEEKAV